MELSKQKHVVEAADLSDLVAGLGWTDLGNVVGFVTDDRWASGQRYDRHRSVQERR